MDIRNERLTLRVACLATLMAVLWGGNNIAIKFSLNGIPPFALAGIRFLVGSLIVLVWVYMDRVSLKMKSGEKGSLVLLAFLFTAQISLLNVGVNHTLAGRSTILISTHPFFVGIFAHILLSGDRMKPLKILGMTLSFLGVVFIFAESFVLKDFQYLLGDFLMLVQCTSFGTATGLYQTTDPGHPSRQIAALAGGTEYPDVFSLQPNFRGQFRLPMEYENCSRYILSGGDHRRYRFYHNDKTLPTLCRQPRGGVSFRHTDYRCYLQSHPIG